jgi:hypothetical protein
MPTPSLILVPARFKTGKLYTPVATTSGGLVLGASGDFNVTRATTATRVNASGFIESVASGIPRLDYFASGGVVGCPALLVEPAATNSIRNNTMVGAVTGSPGTLPTNWANDIGTLTQTIVATGVVSGITYIDIRLSGTASLNVNTIALETTTAITASVGQAWTESAYLSVVSAPNPPTNYQAAIQERNAAGTYLTDGTQNLTLTSNLTRYSFTRTLTNANTGRVTPAIYLPTTIGQAYNFTLRIGLPQMEQSSVATSVIPTTTAAVTRNADVINVSGAVSGCIGQTEGTLYAEVDIRTFANLGVFLSISNGGGNDRIEIYKNTDSKIYFDRVSATASGTTSVSSTSTYSAGILKVAVAYKSGDTIMYINGSPATTVQTATFTFLPITKINIGTNRADISQFNDRIRAAALYTTRLTNAQLAALTT